MAILCEVIFEINTNRSPKASKSNGVFRKGVLKMHQRGITPRLQNKTELPKKSSLAIHTSFSPKVPSTLQQPFPTAAKQCPSTRPSSCRAAHLLLYGRCSESVTPLLLSWQEREAKHCFFTTLSPGRPFLVSLSTSSGRSQILNVTITSIENLQVVLKITFS